MSGYDKDNPVDSGRQYQRLLESTRAVPWEVDLSTWCFTYVGPQIEDILGYSPEVWKEPKFWVNHIHPDDVDWASNFCIDATARGEDHEFEYRMITSDNRVIWVRDIVNVVVDDKGEPVALQGYLFDITERKQVELIMNSLAAAGSSGDVSEFYRMCVQNLAEAYGAKFAFIGLLKEDRQHVRTQAVWAGDRIVDNFEYSLEGTPCKDILDQTKEIIPTGASTLYADDEMLVQMGIDSYFGAPLISSDGETIGLVSVMDTKPLEVSNWTSPILGVFASRILVETERYNATRKLRDRENALSEAQRIAKLGSFEWDRNSGRIYWSDEAVSMLQLPGSKSISNTLDCYRVLVHPEDRSEFDDSVLTALDERRTVVLNHRLKLRDRQVRFVEFRVESVYEKSRQVDIVIGTIHDVTERHAHEDALYRMANYDALTSLPNRWLLQSELERLVETVKADNRKFCLALLDLDGFKEVNDTLGHFAGDELLRQLKPRLEQVMRPSDFVARLGGDEFAVVFNPVFSGDDGMRLAEIVRQAISEPFELEGTHIQIGASIGLSLFPEHGSDASVLLRQADVAMYQAKRKMTGYALYDAERDPYGARRLSLMNDIRRAIDNDDLVLYYQPKIDIGTGEVRSVEALVRWQHPVHGFIPPDEFIPLCEVSDLICHLTEYVIQRAVADIRVMNDKGCRLSVAVNISARDLMDHSLPGKIASALQHAGCGSDCPLQLEITENDLMHDTERASQTVRHLNNLGVRLAIDDFGTGYSSLSYLKYLQVQELKIDRTFVRDMLDDENDASIVRSTIDLAHSLGLLVTAEGVETVDVLDRLSEYGCELAQGYYIAKPMPVDMLIKWLEAGGSIGDNVSVIGS